MLGPKEDLIDSKPKPSVRVSEKVASLAVSNILQIFNYILPFLKSLVFKSRKGEDFIYWEVAVNLRALGYITNPQGLQYLVNISSYINNKRYSSNLNRGKVPNMDEIKNLLNTTPPVYDLTTGLSHKHLSDAIKNAKGGNKGFGVNVYDKGKLVEGSPFPSYLQAALVVLGNKNHSSTISKKIDTNKLYKQRFLFESVKP